jgi:DNA/RNA-binding domain of Phe-tRNA-synthetase-like protein
MNDVAFRVTPAWRDAFPGAAAAALAVSGVANPAECPALDGAKRVLETELAARWAGKTRADIREDPVLAVHNAYYKRFGQNYHVQMQIESVALKGKPIPSRAALVEAMFMAELATGLLTAVHDLDDLRGPVTVDLTTGDERYIRYDGVEEACKPGDMAMSDEIGVLTSVIQGPTTHGRAGPEVRNALFCVYVLPGIPPAVLETHLDAIEHYVGLISPAEFGPRHVLTATETTARSLARRCRGGSAPRRR